MENTSVVYRSKISYLIFAPTFLVLLFVGYSTFNAKHVLPLIFLLLIFIFVMVGYIFSTVYIINGTNLNVKSGFLINKNININSITRISPNSSILSAPAVSFDRIEVFYNKYDSIVISPRDKNLFVKNLKQINPSIVVLL